MPEISTVPFFLSLRGAQSDIIFRWEGKGMATVGLPRMVARFHLTQLNEDQDFLAGAHALAYRDQQLSFSPGPSLAAPSSSLALWIQGCFPGVGPAPRLYLGFLALQLVLNLPSTFIIL